MAAAAARFRLSALPGMGIRTDPAACSCQVLSTPCASLPKTHARGTRRSSPHRSMPSRACESASTIAMPAAAHAWTASPGSTPVAMGRWKSEPAVERTHLPLCGSTDPSVRITPLAPMASAERMIVPALPGSDTLSSTTSSGDGAAAAAAMTLASDVVTRGHTAMRPCGCRVCDIAVMTSSVAVTTRAPEPRAASTMSG